MSRSLDSVQLGGAVALCCRLSTSFVLIALRLNKDSQAAVQRLIGGDCERPVLDCVVRTADGQSKEQVAAIERTCSFGSEVFVRGYRPLEKCNCAQACEHVVLHLFDAAPCSEEGRDMSWVTAATAGEGRAAVQAGKHLRLNHSPALYLTSHPTTHPRSPQPSAFPKRATRKRERRLREGAAATAEALVGSTPRTGR